MQVVITSTPGSTSDVVTRFLGGNTTTAANAHLLKNLSYDPIRDFDPFSQVTINPLLLVVRANLPIQSVSDFASYAKARPAAWTS